MCRWSSLDHWIDLDPLTKSGSLNWPWSTKILGQCDVKHMLTSLIKIITQVLKISTCIITSITVRLILVTIWQWSSSSSMCKGQKIDIPLFQSYFTGLNMNLRGSPEPVSITWWAECNLRGSPEPVSITWWADSVIWEAHLSLYQSPGELTVLK